MESPKDFLLRTEYNRSSWRHDLGGSPHTLQEMVAWIDHFPGAAEGGWEYWPHRIDFERDPWIPEGYSQQINFPPGFHMPEEFDWEAQPIPEDPVFFWHIVGVEREDTEIEGEPYYRISCSRETWDYWQIAYSLLGFPSVPVLGFLPPAMALFFGMVLLGGGAAAVGGNRRRKI